jgi:hypothetical protein
MACLSSDYREQKDRNRERVPGTCKWFLEHPVFLNWKQDTSKKLLLVTAEPGCGKSVLSKALVDEGLLDADVISYFCFKDDVDCRKGADALCAILHQLFTTHSDLFNRHALKRWKHYGETGFRSQFGVLWDILMDVTSDSDAGHVTCIMDALDECESASRKALIEKPSCFHRAGNTTQSKIRFIVTSRPYADIQGEFGYNRVSDLPSIHLKGEEESETIKHEIDLYIDDQIPRIACASNPPLSEDIQHKSCRAFEGDGESNISLAASCARRDQDISRI